MEDIIFFVVNIKDILIGVYHSNFVFVLKIFLGIYTLVIFIDIILLLIQRGVAGNMREKFLGMDAPRAVLDKKEKTRQDWETIKGRIAGKNMTSYKIAVIEADNYIGAIVKGLKYSGSNLGEMLENIPESHFPNIAELRNAHQIRNKIIHDDNYFLTEETAKGILEQYEEFLKVFNIID